MTHIGTTLDCARAIRTCEAAGYTTQRDHDAGITKCFDGPTIVFSAQQMSDRLAFFCRYHNDYWLLPELRSAQCPICHLPNAHCQC